MAPFLIIHSAVEAAKLYPMPTSEQQPRASNSSLVPGADKPVPITSRNEFTCQASRIDFGPKFLAHSEGGGNQARSTGALAIEELPPGNTC